MSFFSDIGKQQKELLEDDFFSTKKIKFKSKNESNTEVTTEGELLPKNVAASISLTKKGFPLSFEKVKIKSDGRLVFDASLKTSPFSKFTIVAEDGRQEPGKPLQSYAKLGCEFDFPSFGVVTDVDLVNGPIFKTSSIYKIDGSTSIGAEVIVNTHFEESVRPELSDLNVGFSYTGQYKDWNFSAKSSDFMKSFKFTYLHIASPFVTVVSQLDYRTKLNAQKMTLGSVVKLDDKSTLKVKVDSGAILTGSLQHKLSEFIKMTLCAEVDVKDLSADSHKFGVGLTFSV